MSKTTELLERMAPAPPHAEDLALSLAARRELGYEVLAELDEQMKLRTALDELGVSPFTDESVERYKHAAVADAGSEIAKGKALLAVSWIGATLSLVCFGPALLGWFVSWKVGLASLIGLIAGLVMVGSVAGTTVKEQASWNVTPLLGYGSQVPKDVLRLAVQLKKRLPSVELMVHELVQSERVLDPFLAARLGKTTYFVAVWDEPKFEAQCL